MAYADSNVLGRRKEPVYQDTHKRGVETKLWGKLGKSGICHALRYHHGANGDTYRGWC